MQLSGPEILSEMMRLNPHNPGGMPNIVIKPFDTKCLGSNSYDLHLAPEFKVYKNTVPYGMKTFIPYVSGKEFTMRDWFVNDVFYNRYLKGDPEYDFRNPKFLVDPFEEKETIDFVIPESGAILSPQFGYLASTYEETKTFNYFPYIDGKSSLGRNFILNHHTAGRGDDGFCGTWTLEISVKNPTIVRPMMRIGQIYFDEFRGQQKRYDENPASHYRNQSGPTPAAKIQVEEFLKQEYEKCKNMSDRAYYEYLYKKYHR